MSRTVIQDIVVPIVQQILSRDYPCAGFGHAEIRDEELEKYLLDELLKHINHGSEECGCGRLREFLEEMQRNKPEELRVLLRQLLRPYIKLKASVHPFDEKPEDPPDRFSEIRKKAKELWRVA